MAYFLDARPESLLGSRRGLSRICVIKITDIYTENPPVRKDKFTGDGSSAARAAFQNKSNETNVKPEKFWKIVDFGCWEHVGKQVFLILVSG